MKLLSQETNQNSILSKERHARTLYQMMRSWNTLLEKVEIEEEAEEAEAD